VTEAEEIMENARLYWIEEYARYGAMRRKLGKKWAYESDITRARIWRDLGFALQKWMVECLRHARESMVPQVDPAEFKRSESVEARERARRVLEA
jgi:hypothetical protein